MTAERAPARADVASRMRRALPLAALGLVLVVAAVLVSTPRSALPLHPRSAGPAGTKALTLILREVGADVRILDGAPTEDIDTMLVAVDNLGPQAADHVLTFVEQGGVLVVADFDGRLSPGLRPTAAGGTLTATRLNRGCDVPALRDVENIRVRQAWLFPVPDDATGCYRRGTVAWLLGQSRGDGTVITTGGAGWVTNAGIREEGNAQLAVALLAPQPGTRVGILVPDFADPAAATTTLSDLIPVWLKRAFAQLLVAFGVLVAYRSRRLGRPLREPQQVRLAGSELVVAVGRLLQRTGARERAAALLRADLRSALARRLAGHGDDPERLAQTVAQRSSVPLDQARAVIAGPPPRSDDELVALAQDAEAVRHAALSGNRRKP